jgi:pyruvate decarboxylase
MDAEYNDIAEWRFKDLIDVFGGAQRKARTYQVKTKKEIEELLGNAEFNAADVLQFVEVYMPKEDAPRALKLTAEASAKTNSKQE